MLKKVLYCTVIVSITYFENTEIYASSALQSRYNETINTNNTNTDVNTSNSTNQVYSTDNQFIQMNISDLQSFQNIMNKYNVNLKNDTACNIKVFHSREKIKIIKELLKFWYQYHKPQFKIDYLKYNPDPEMWTYNGQSEFNYSIGFDLYDNMNLTNSNKIIINQIENNPILSIKIDKNNNIINIYRYFQQDETLQEVVMQILSNYYNINNYNITNVLSSTRNEELINSNWKIFYANESNMIKILQVKEELNEDSKTIEKSDKVELEINIGSVKDNYITITKHFKDEADLTNNQKSIITKILTNYSNKLNKNTSINLPEISYDEQNNLFKFGNKEYYNFGNDNKYAIYGECKYEPQINIYPIGESILTIDTKRLQSIILSNFLKDYVTSHKTIELKLINKAKSLSQQGNYAQSAEIFYSMKDYYNAALLYAGHAEYNPQKRVEYYINAAQIFYDMKDYHNAVSNYENAAYNEEDTDKRIEYYNNEIEIYKQMKNYCKVADILSYIAYNESNIKKKVEYYVNAAEMYLENKAYYNAAISWNIAAENEQYPANKAQYYSNAGDAYTKIKDYNTVINTNEKAGDAYRLVAEVDNISSEEKIQYYKKSVESYKKAGNYKNAVLNYLFAVETNNSINKDEYYKNADEVIQKTNYYTNNIKSAWEALKNQYNDNTDSKEYKAIANRINALY